MTLRNSDGSPRDDTVPLGDGGGEVYERVEWVSVLNNVPPFSFLLFLPWFTRAYLTFFLSNPRYIRVLVGGITILLLKLYPLFFEKLSPCIPPCALFVAVAVVAVCCWLGICCGRCDVVYRLIIRRLRMRRVH